MPDRALPADWKLGRPYRIIDIGNDAASDDKSGSLMLLHNNGAAIADTDIARHVQAWFRCCDFNSVLLPADCEHDVLTKMAAWTKRISRKCGYNNIVRNMVIAASLHSGKFNDDFLFQNQ